MKRTRCKMENTTKVVVTIQLVMTRAELTLLRDQMRAAEDATFITTKTALKSLFMVPPAAGSLIDSYHDFRKYVKNITIEAI